MPTYWTATFKEKRTYGEGQNVFRQSNVMGHTCLIAIANFN